MAQKRQSNRRADARRQTRAQRREEERQQKRVPAASSGISPVQLIGGVVTVAVVAIIVVVAIIRANQAATPQQSQGTGLANPNDWNPARKMLAVGTQAPAFTLRGIDGRTYSLAAQRGHPVVLEFFAVWCPHCQREAAVIQNVAKKYESKGVRVWAILASPYGPNYDNSLGQDTSLATKADVQFFSAAYNEHVPKLIDPNFRVFNRYGYEGYPGIFVIDKQGKIVSSRAGEQPAAYLSNAIDHALNSP
jgi:peroxiredoxin